MTLSLIMPAVKRGTWAVAKCAERIMMKRREMSFFIGEFDERNNRLIILFTVIQLGFSFIECFDFLHI